MCYQSGMNRILIHPAEQFENGTAEVRGDRARHMHSVLNAQPGRSLRIGLVNGPRGRGIVQRISEESVLLNCEFESHLPPRPALDLLLAMPRPKVLKRLWAQLAALGLGRIFITGAEKVEKYYFDTHILDPGFYTGRFIEGLQQAGDTLLPAVRIIRHLPSFLEKEPFPTIGTKLIADPCADRSVFQCLEPSFCAFPAPAGRPAPRQRNGRILLAVGPEGGWTPGELDLFVQHGFKLCHAGKRILRTDTVCISLLFHLNQWLACAHM